MIRLEHLNLVVADIGKSLDFYQAAFPHWTIRSQGEMDWYGVNRRWLHFGDDYQYLSLNDRGIGENRELSGHQLGLAHFAFVTQNIFALINRLETNGFKPVKKMGENSARRNIYFIDPDGFEVEFVEYLSDLPSERNLDD